MLTVVGEALLDLVTDGDAQVFNARPGGSPANVAVGLARLGTPVALATQLGDDPPGRLIAEHLTRSGVGIDLLPAGSAQTSLALASVDGQGSADYSFHLAWDITTGPDVPPDCVCVHSGSIAAGLAPGAGVLDELITSLRRRGGVALSYDPNIRPTLLGPRDSERVRVERQVAQADIVKVSTDDIGWLYPGCDPHAVARTWVTSGPALVVLTRGSDGAYAVNQVAEASRPAPAVLVQDTVGAGDAFTAGLLDALLRAGLLGARQRARIATMDRPALTEIIDFAALVAAKTCERKGANPPTRAELVGSVHGRSTATG